MVSKKTKCLHANPIDTHLTSGMFLVVGFECAMKVTALRVVCDTIISLLSFEKLPQ
jgi:hypothetical protein